MKIQETLHKSSHFVNRVDTEDKSSVRRNDGLFDKHLVKADHEFVYEKMCEMLDKITKQGQKLSERMDIRELKIYKKMISEFLYDAVNYSHKFNKESILDRRGRHRIFAIISKVNSHVDELTQEVLKEERDHLKILQKLDDIRGLLLDILI